MRTAAPVGALLAIFALVPTGSAAQSVAINLRAGTTGVAPGVTVGLTDHFNARVEIPWLGYVYEGEHVVEETITLDYTAEVDFLSFAAMVDYHPFAGRFRLSGGFVKNGMILAFEGAAADGYTFSQVTFTAEQIGGLEGEIQLGSDIAPYAGIGFGNAVDPDKRLGFTLDIGAVFIGAPTVSMSGTGMIGPTAESAPTLQSNLDWVYAYPVFSVGLSYRVF